MGTSRIMEIYVGLGQTMLVWCGYSVWFPILVQCGWVILPTIYWLVLARKNCAIFGKFDRDLPFML